MSDRMPRVGVILLNWNGWRDTIECMETLFRLDYEGLTVVICEQASSDGSADRIREWASGQRAAEPTSNPQLAHLTTPPVPKPIAMQELTRAEAESASPAPVLPRLVMIHAGDNLGSAGGNNLGLRYLFTQPDVEYAWILNNDILVAPDALTELVKCARSDSRIGAVGGHLLDFRDPALVQAAGGGRISKWQGFPVATVDPAQAQGNGRAARLDWVIGGNMLSPIAALREIGPIDETYFVYMEDVDHSVRMRRAGYRFGYAEKSLAWHKGGGTVGYHSPRHDYYMVRNALMFSQKHFRRTMPAVLAYTFYRCFLPKVVRGQWTRLKAVTRAYRDYRNGVTGRASI